MAMHRSLNRLGIRSPLKVQHFCRRSVRHDDTRLRTVISTLVRDGDTIADRGQFASLAGNRFSRLSRSFECSSRR
jgi:hypothetical protein